MDTKTITVTLASLLLASGGTAALYTGQVADLEADKAMVLKQYVYSQISSDRLPELDLSTVSAEEMTNAYIEVVVEPDPTEPNLFITGKKLAVQKGDYVCAK